MPEAKPEAFTLLFRGAPDISRECEGIRDANLE